MSTPTAPATPIYPLSALNIQPTVSPSTVPSDATFDPTKPQKTWRDPAAVVVVAANTAFGSTLMTYSGYISVNGAIPVLTPFSMTALEAATYNCPTSAEVEAANLSGNAGQPGYAQSVPVPARALLPTESIFNAMPPNGWTVSNSANGGATPTVGNDPRIDRLVTGVNEILSALGKSQV